MKRTVFLLTLMVTALATYSQVDTLSVRRLSTAWISHDVDGTAFQVFDTEDVTVGGFYLSEDDIGSGLLRVCGPSYDLWVDGRLLTHASEGCRHFSKEDIFGAQMVDTVYCAVISPELAEVEVDLLVIRPGAERLYELPGDRARNPADNAWWLLMIVVLVLLAFLRIADDQTYKALMRLAFFQRRVGYDEDALFSLSNLIMMLLLGLLLGFHIVLFQGETSSLPVMLAALGSGALMFYGFLLGKVLILQVSGSLFQYHRIKTLHFRSYLLFTTILMLIVYLLQLAGQWFEVRGEFYWALIRYAGPLISAVFVIWIYFQLTSEVAKRKLHIIAYLCTTEILPTFILANWLLN